MEEHNPTPCHSRRLALKPPLPPEVISGGRRRSRSTKSSTIRTSREKSSFKPELAQIVSTHPSSSTIVETESSQLPVVMIHSIIETILPRPEVVQSHIDPDPVSSLPESLNPESEQQEVVPTLVIPQSYVATKTPISHIQPSKIYFGPDGEVLPLGLIEIEEIPQPDTPLSQTHFGGDLYLY